MPIFEVNGQRYNVANEHLDAFSQEFPDASTIEDRNGKSYRVKARDYSNFLSEFDNQSLDVNQDDELGFKTNEATDSLFELNTSIRQEKDPYKRQALEMKRNYLEKEQKKQREEELRNHLENSGEIKRLQEIQGKAQVEIDKASFFDRYFNADTRAAVAARDAAEEALDTYSEAQYKDRDWVDKNVGGVLRGIFDKVGDLRTWDFGASGVASGVALKDAYEKVQRGEAVSNAEQNMLDAYGLASAVQEAYQGQVGMAYRAGGSLPESAAFMGSLILNPAGGVGKKIAETAAKSAVKKYGTSLIGKLAKGAARVGGDIVEMGVATAVPGAGRVAEDYYNRLNGQSVYDIDENGIIRYGGQYEQEEADKAIWKAFGSQFIENYSESVGNYFSPIGSMLANLSSKGLKAAHLGKLAEAVTDISSSQWSKGLQRFKQATKFDGFVGEYLEEVAGNFMNAATVGDMNFSSPEDPRSVFNPETNIETALSCALMSGTMYAVEAPISAYNKYTVKRNLRNADAEASKLWGERWNDMRSQMDAADPELLAQLLTGVENAKDLSAEQKQAAKNYGVRLMQSQGFNARKVQNASENTEDANAASNAYDEGTQQSNEPAYIYQTAKEVKKLGEALKSADETVFNSINTMIQSGVNPEIYFTGLREPILSMAKSYYHSLLKQKGVNDSKVDAAEERIQSDNASIDAATDTQTGNYAQVTAILPDGLGGTKEVVGNVVGWIGDSPMFVPDGMEVTEENKIPLQPGQWNPETLIERPAEEVKAINEDIIREEVAAQAERESKYAPEVLDKPMPEGQFVSNGKLYIPFQSTPDGVEYEVYELDEKGKPTTTIALEVKQLTIDDYHDMLQADLEAQEAVQAEIAQSESVGEQVNAPVNTEVNNPMENAESTPMSEEVQSATEEKSTQPVIPTKKDGSIDFVAYGREGTLKTLGEKYGEKLPNKVAVTAKALAEDVVKAEEKLAKAEEAYDNAPIGREQKAEQARDKARQELEEVKKEAEYWKAIDEEIKEAQKAREAIVNPTVEPDMTDEPMTTEEFVAKALADGGIRLTSDSYKKELGYGEKEHKRFPKMFAKKENGGLSIEEAGEWLMQWDSENGTNFFDQEDANAGRDALINFLGSVRTWGDITGYIRRNREQLAERESEGLRNEVESAIEANYHMTPEEYATLQEVESVENPFGGLDVATKDAIFVEAYEEYEQSLNPKQNDEGRTSEIAEGNGVVLPEERTDNEGGTSERQGERPDLSEGAVQQNDAAQEAEQVEEPITIQEGESPVAFAERVLEEQRRKPLRNRANEWAKALGVKVHFIERLEDVENQAAYLALSNGSKVAGWYEGATGEVFLYMPNLDNIAEVDKTYIHEVVAHKGLREMLGKERFNELCDKVWDMMPDKEKAEFIQYEGVNGDTRAAADEYIAYLAEKENLTPEEQTIWDSIVKMFRDMLDKALNGIIGKSKLTDEDISNLIKASYANLKSGTEGGATNAEGSRMRAVERIEENVGEVDAKKGDVRFAVRDILKGEERKQAIKDLMEVTGRSKTTVEKWLEAEESLASVILNEDNVGILDMEADESVPSIWKNSDYPQGTVEFSNICKKRLPFTTIYQRLQKEFPNTLFDAQTLNTIRTTMKEMGEDVACALCFVEDRRQLLGEIGQGFIDAVKGMDVELNDNQKTALDKLRESGDKYVPNLFDIITLDGMKELRKKHPVVAQAFVEYNNARGMQSGRLFQAYSAYNREILKYNKKKVEGINNNGGLRIFSFSDFEAHHLIDLVQVLTDCAAKGIKVQGYTKVPEFAKAVKDTNAKINRSLIPKGVGYVDANYVPKEGEAVSPNVINGKRLLFDTVEGIDVNNPNFFDSTNSKSVGNILVAINDEHARLAMADPFVDYIIGFHTGQSKAILKGKGIDTWVNYKNEQLDKEIVTDEKGNQKMKNAPKHGLNIYTDVLNVAEAEGNPIKTAKQFTERFIEECNKRGWIPRFHRFLNRAKDGRFLYTPGYHKFLIDFKLFDKNGKILPQEAVVPVFDNEFNKQILDDYVKGVKEEMPNDAVYEAVKEAVGLGEGKRFRVTPQQDKDYLEAVNSGNLSKAQQMVDEVLEGAGYTIRGEHGTTHKFTIFSNVNANIENSFGKGFYFTSDIKDAEKNYASDTGADLTNRIELLAERMEYEDGYEDMSYEERKEEATKRLNGGENLIISAAIRMENPCIFSIDPDGVYQETIFEAEEAYNEETDEYSEPEGNLVDFVNSLQNVLDSGEYWGADRVDTYELLSDGYYTADQLKDKMDEMLMDITDEEGNIASSEIFRQALEGMGFDGIIDNAPSHRFKGMGLSRETKHYIAFSPNQIKQSDAVTYDNEGNIIPLSQRADSSNDDIRFRVKSFETANEELDKDEISINNEELMDEYGLSDVTLSKSGNHVTLSKVVVEDKGKGNGTRFMEDLTNNADNNGWILALTPDTSFGGSSVARLKKFYKRFGFKDNKGRNTDFETRESMVRPVGGNRFRISNQNQEIFAHEPAIDYVSQANDIVEVPRDEVMYTMNNIASQLYKTSGRFMRQLYQNGTLGRVLKGDYAEIDQIKAKNEYDHAKPILDEYLNELVWMKYQATDAAQEVINGVIPDVEYAIKYYKDLSLGKDVWRTEERPRFRIVEKQREDVNKGVDSFTSKYNSKPVSVASSEMTDEELEKAVPTSLVEDTRKAFEEGVKGKYSVKADKIYIFADNVTKEELEDTLFHENLHPMFSGNPIIEEFYTNFNAKYPEQVEMLAEGYEESEVPEEVFVTNLAVGMQRGNFKMVEPFLAESSREDLYNTLKAFGYDYEQERGRRNPERNSGKGSDVAEGKKVVDRSRGKENSEGQRESSREQAEKLRDLFGRVADMGLDGVLGNEAYDRAMMDIYSVLPEDSRKEVIDDAFNHYGMNIAPAVSDYIHGKSDGNILDKIVAIIRNALRKVGFNIDLNGNEVKYLAWRSKKPLDRSNLVDMAEDIYKKYQLKVGEYSTNDDGTTPDGGGTRFRRVYHGSGASFDKFDHSFMGTGEGNQSFGWGTYVTDVKAVGEKYAGLKADNSPIAAQTLRWLDENSTYENFVTKGEGARRKKTIENAREFLEDMKKDGASEDVINAYEQDLKDAERAITEDGYNQTKENMVASLNRHLYEVEIPDDNGSNYIAWDKMLPKGQAERIKDAIRNSKFFKEYEKDYKQLAEERLDAWTKTNGGRAYKLLGNIVWNEKDLSQILSEAGFAGFKYPTNYFSGGNEDGTNNYVIFNEKDLEIKEHTRFRVANKLQVRDEYEATIKKGGYQAREAVQDSMLSLRRFQELIEKESGKKLKDFENAWMHENRLSSVVQAAIHEMERKFYKPMMESVKKLMKAADIKQEEVADYLMLKHGIERNREMAVRKALTDAEGKIDRAHLEQWYQDKEAIRNDASLDTWRKKQEAMDNLALSYGADMSRDYSGLTSMFDTDDIEECTNRAYDEVEALENAYPAEIEALGKAVKAMTQNTLDESFRSGLMDRKVYDELSKDMYDYYIPLRGFEETTSEEVYAYLDQDRGAFNAPLQRAKGRSSKSDNPIAYLKSIAESGIMQGERNKMKQTFLNMVINHPSDLVSIHEGVWVVFNPATGEWEAAAPPAIPNNATPADVEAAMEAWEQQMELAAQNDPTLVKKVSEASDIPYRVVGNRMNQHQIIVKRLGKSYTLTVNGNPRLAMALNGLTNPNNTSNDGKVSAYVSGKFGALNRFLASVYTTKNPDFVVSNFLRDTFYTNTIVRAKEGNSYANKFHKHYAELLMPGKMISLFKKYENGTLDMSNATEAAFKDFMMNGGETGYSNLKDLENIKKQIAKDLKGNRLEVVEKVAEKLDILNRAVENTARFAAYLTSREEGRSIAKSVFDAKEISVNFNKKGAGGTFFGMTGQTKLGNLAAMVGAGGRALYVFFNAAIQGTTNLLHVMKKSPKGTSAGIAAMFLMGAVLPFLLDDDEEKDYYDLPEHVRRNHLILPGFGDAWISIPLPIEYRIMYGMGELLTSWRTGHERGSDIGRKMLNLTGQALPLNFLEEGFDAFIPSSLSPLWQVYNNKSWTGLPLYKDNEFNKDDPEYTKAYKNVDKTLYNVSKALYDWTFDEENQEAGINLNPAVLEALARGYFGGFATQLGNLGKTWETIAGEREFDWRSIPIGNRVFKSGDERTKEKRITNEYFENMEKLDFMQSRERTLKKTINGVSVPQEDKDRAKEDYDKMKDTDIYKKYQEFKKKKKDVDKLRKRMKEKGSTEELEKKLTTAQEEANKVVR